jgi:DNA processing protein
MTNDLLYQLALIHVPHIGSVHAKALVEKFGSAEAIFKTPGSRLEKTEGIGTIRARSLKSFTAFKELEKEIAFIEKYRINPLFLTDSNYPQRLLNCYDPPALLFYRGAANLNASRVVAVIGTRSNTEYGKQLTEKLLKELASPDLLIVSGLAFGIDAVAHRSAIKNNTATVGVLAHGLDTIYPTEHHQLAKDIIKYQGGLLTEYCSNCKPDKHHFPTRNRIVAGMSDAIVVVETGIKGGSMITAELANGYNKDVFAYPGKTTDTKSTGCNYLIKNNKAILLTEAKDLAELMGWQEKTTVNPRQQQELVMELSPDERLITEILREKEAVHIDELHLKSGLSSSAVAAAILSLELQNMVNTLPGKLYKLN